MKTILPVLLVLVVANLSCNRAPSLGGSGSDGTGTVPLATGGNATAPLPKPTDVDSSSNSGSSADSATSPGAEVQIMSWPETEQWIAGQKGKIVVLDVWSTYCGPCIRELPHLTKLQSALGDGVVGVTLSVDYIGVADKPPESYQEQVQKVLNRVQSRVTNVLCSTPDDEVFSSLGIGSIPCVVVYDREGKVHKVFHNDQNEYGEDGFTYADHVAPLVKQLQSEP